MLGLGSAPKKLDPNGDTVAWMPLFISLKEEILKELSDQPFKILALNRSRRESVCAHLEVLAGIPPSKASLAADPEGLKRWVEGHRTLAQNKALASYFEEVALIYLGQAVLLKAWSDRGLRPWNLQDLSKLNWTLITALKPQIPLDRDGWQLTKSIYSWYTPAAKLQEEIWEALAKLKFTDEGPGVLLSLIHGARGAHSRGGHSQDAPHAECRGYDLRFFQAIWDHITDEPEANLSWKSRIFFSPTLRDGSMVRTGPSQVTWVGFESSSFQIILAELVHLWWGASPPPFWAVGNGLESHTREQMPLALGSPKPSLLSRISEMEACELALVLEERVTRGSTRSSESARFKEYADRFDYFKKLRSAGTSLGDLQACVALSKLRPGGILIWTRDEPLGQIDGAGVLSFILDRAKLLAEWDFSHLEHALPSPLPVFSKHIYLLMRENDVEARLSHRPLRISVAGQIRSHVELPMLLEDSFKSWKKTVESRGPWQITLQKSPTPQKNWTESWPDLSSQNTVRALDKLRETSLPLANSTTIRETPEGDPTRDKVWSIPQALSGLWIQAVTSGEQRKLITHALPRPRAETKGSGFLILVPDESWVSPLSSYLESPMVHEWLEHHAERRGERWVLDEQLVKYIPIPKVLLKALGASTGNTLGDAPSRFAEPLPGDWESIASKIAIDPKLVRQALDRLRDEPERAMIRAQLFVRTSRLLTQVKQEQKKLLSLVGDQGQLNWKDFLEILPKSEMIAIPLQPRIVITGNIPPHFPVGRISRVRTPKPGIMLATETGMQLTLASESGPLLEMLWGQLEVLTHPTWNEILALVKVPRRLDVAEGAAVDILRAHGKQATRVSELVELLSACLIF